MFDAATTFEATFSPCWYLMMILQIVCKTFRVSSNMFFPSLYIACIMERLWNCSNVCWLWGMKVVTNTQYSTMQLEYWKDLGLFCIPNHFPDKLVVHFSSMNDYIVSQLPHKNFYIFTSCICHIYICHNSKVNQMSALFSQRQTQTWPFNIVSL